MARSLYPYIVETHNQLIIPRADRGPTADHAARDDVYVIVQLMIT
jgi:hypothetical protein